MNKTTNLFVVVLVMLSGCIPFKDDAFTDQQTAFNSTFANMEIQYEAPTLEFAFGESLRFENFTTDDGLSNSNILDIVQDPEGYIWIATGDGLNRYDGKDFKTFRYNAEDPNSIGANFVFSLLLDDEDTLWVGTDPGGLNKYNSKTESFTRYKNDPDNENSLIHNSVWSLTADVSGDIWIGTMGGLDRFDPETESFTHYLFDPEDPYAINGPTVYSGLLDSSGTLWFATRNGINQYIPEKDHFKTYSHDPENPESLSSGFVWHMYEDDENNFWVGTRRGGLNLFDRENGTFRAFQHDPADPDSISDNSIRHISEDRHGNLWIATENGGLNHFDRESQRFYTYQTVKGDRDSLVSNTLQGLYEDRSGTLWIMSQRSGISKLYAPYQRFRIIKEIPGTSRGLNSNNVHSLFKDGDSTLWVGTTEGGLNRLDLESGEFSYYTVDPAAENSISSNNIYGLYTSAESNDLWIATVGGGLVQFDKRNETFSSYLSDDNDPETLSSNYLTTVLPAGDNQMWVGTLGFGLDLFDLKTKKVVNFRNDPEDPNSLSENTIFAIIKDESGSLWVGTSRGGLNYLAPGSKEFTRYQNDPDNLNSIISNSVYSLAYDPRGYVWCGTTNGLSKLDIFSGKFKNYDFNDKLPNNTIHGVLIDRQGFVWISTGYGLAKFNPEREEITVFTREEGLQGNQFNLFAYHTGEDGSLYFGGTNGLNVIQPEDIVTNYSDTAVTITDLEIFNERIPIGSDILPFSINHMDHIFLPYDKDVITLIYKGLNFQLSSKTMYQHRLSGFKEHWSPVTSQSRVTYTNLDPGTYSFQVKAANHDGVWGAKTKELKITILPPWWDTLIFKYFATFSVIMILLLIIFIREKGIRKQKKVLEEQVHERTQKYERANKNLRKSLSEAQELKSIIQEMSIRDPLTNLYNRRFLADHIQKEIARVKREDKKLGFLILDLDDFKLVNDTHGHIAGDLVLKSISKVLEEKVREGDIVSRFGGEEFVIVLPGITLKSLKKRCEEIIFGIKEMAVNFEGKDIPVTASIGATLFPDHGKNYDDLLKIADNMLYNAKRTGKNKYIIFRE